VIDMRGNPGGIVKTLEQLTARLFDHDVKIADLKGRKSMKPSVAKKRKTPFTGKTVVLVDSDSASAAEVLARVIQLEKRGLVGGRACCLYPPEPAAVPLVRPFLRQIA